MSQWINRQALLLDFEPQFIFRSPLYSFRFPAALGITSHGVQPDVKRLKCGGWELRAPAVPLFSPGLYAGEREMGGPKGWDPGGRELRRVPWSWAERAFAGGPPTAAPLAQLTVSTQPATAESCAPPAPLARLSSPRVGLLSHSTPPRTRGLRCPLAGKYFTVY